MPVPRAVGNGETLRGGEVLADEVLGVLADVNATGIVQEIAVVAFALVAIERNGSLGR